jgi:hypothetical protein
MRQFHRHQPQIMSDLHHHAPQLRRIKNGT